MARTIKAGSTSFHPYAFYDENNDLVGFVENFAYKLTGENNSIIIDWTTVGLLGSGTIQIDGEYNIPETPTDILRCLSIKVEHNGGKIITDKEIYVLEQIPGIEPEPETPIE